MRVDRVSNRPQGWKRRATPTAFADWVFHRMHPEYQRVSLNRAKTHFQWSGEYEHDKIERLRLWMRRSPTARRWAAPEEPWRLEYVDSPEPEKRKLFTASSLRVDGESVRGHPDVVLRNKRSNSILILERKVIHQFEGRSTQLQSGYMNNWCQLWCYAWMDEWLDAETVLMFVQYRYRDWKQGGFSEPLRYVPLRYRRDPSFHAEVLSWFEAYGGQFVRPR